MADFNDTHKAERSTSFFQEGIHQVKIGSFMFDKTPKNQEFVELEVFDPANEECTAKVRLWFTTDGAIAYAFNILRGIFVHNAPEDKKDAVRDKFNKIKNTIELEGEMGMLIGKDCWLQVYQNGTYESNGKVKPNYSRDIFGYMPSPKVSSNNASSNDITITDDEGNEQQIAPF